MANVLTDDQMFDIVSNHDARFDGAFFFSCADSKIYCVPSCRVRTPLHRNIVFFPDRESAMATGRRPCKRCCPDSVPRKDVDSIWYPEADIAARR